MNLRALLTRPIAFHRIFVTITGSVNAGIMLSQAYYWSDKTKDGWFFKTQSDWEDETGLSRYEQEGARKILQASGFWFEDKKGLPAKLFFKINEDAIFDRISQYAEKPHTDASMRKTSILVVEKPASIYNSKTTTETTIAESEDSASKSPVLFSDTKQLSDKPKKKRATGSVYAACVDFWLKEFHHDWTYTATHGLHMNQIIKKIREVSKRLGREDDEYIIAFFKKFCERLPDWYKDKDLPKLNSSFNEILTELQNGKSKQKITSRWQQAEQQIDDFLNSPD